MRRLRKCFSILLLIIESLMLSGCWNYREIDEMAIVSALAIDKDAKSNKFNIAIEIIHAEHAEKGSNISPKIFKSKGDTIFEAVRDSISESGRRAYWSHCKAVIISKNIAEKDISVALDWLFRDQELRRDVNIFISSGNTAEEILHTDTELENTVGFNLNSTMRNQKANNRFPKAELGDIAENFSKEEKSSLIPLVGCDKEKLNKTAVLGSAILKREKVIDYLSGEDTFNALWIRGKVKTGIIEINDFIYPKSKATIEIFSSTSKTKVNAINASVGITVNVSVDVGLAEISSAIPFTKKEEQEKINKEIEEDIAERLTYTIKKVQDEDKTDIFNFYNKVRIQQPKYYKKVSLKWGEEFSNLSVEVKANVHIRGSAIKYKQIKVSE
jgi:spore germination protein KC